MELKTLQTDMIAAMKSGDKTRKDVLSSAIGAIKKAGIDKGCRDNIPEVLVNEVLRKEQRSLQEMIDTCPSTRTDLLDVYNSKITILKEYVPQLETDGVIIAGIIYSLMKKSGIEITKANKGKLMKVVMPQLKGKVDMSIANKCFKELL